MINKPKSMLSLEDLVARVERARAAYDWEAVVSLARQALNQEELLPETAYALLDGRAEAHQRLGDLAAEGADLERMARLAGELGDLECQVRVTLRLADLYMRQGHLVEARRVAQSALDEARSIGDRALEAAGLLALSMPHVQESRFAEGRDYAEQAAALFRALGDPVGEAWAVLTSSIANSRQERVVKAAAELRTALELFRSRGHREGEARTLNNMAIAHPDLAQKRTLYEQALAAYDAIGDRRGQAQIYNNLALTNAQMGLYARACEDASEAVETAGRMGARVDLSYYLDTLARGYLGLGDAATAQGLLEEGLALAQETGVVGIQGTYEFALAQVARARGRVADACDLYRTAAGHFASVGIPAEQATCLAWLGAAQLVLGDVEGALASTAQAITLLESIGGAGTEYPPQEIWWCRYRVLTSIPPSPTPTEETRRRDEAWRALDRAREVMLAGVAGLSDDGLRRNYLNKVPTNRQIVGEWLRQAGRRGTSPAPLVGGLTGPGSGQEQFRRMLDIGLRLNARRQAGDLARFVVDQVVELTGAERVALYRQDEAGRRRVAAEFSVEGVTPLSSERGAGEPHQARGEAESLLDDVSLKRQAILRYVPADASELEQCSQLCVPLVAAGSLLGLIYADMAGLYGRFTRRDRDLLALLANQAAVALENAAWAESLERRVQERTAELEVMNRVQQGLAAPLAMQAKYDLVGDEILGLFDAQALLINTYDQATGQQHLRYHFERGQRFYEEPTPISSVGEYLIRTREVLVFNEDAGRHWDEFGLDLPPGTEKPQSMVFVPLIVADEVRGSISLQNLDRERAFSEADVRLLTTLANSTSVALENARLFAETQDLLEQTQQRNAELAVINSVQQGLARQLDFQAIIDLVGDEIHRIFAPPTVKPELHMVMIALYDAESQVGRVPYWVRGTGKRLAELTFPLGAGMTSRVIETQEPLLLGTVEDQIAWGAVRVEDGTDQDPESWLGVPIRTGERVIGVLSVADPRPHHFGEGDVRLLSTLAASLGVALENARLFEETSRLLAETRQRAAELSTVNRISQALASQLDLESLIQLVGEQIRRTFQADIAYVALVDRQSRQIHFPYQFGERLTRLPLGQGLTSRILESCEPLLINRDIEGRRTELGIQRVGVESQSYLGVPIMAGQEAIGVLSAQSTAEEGRFDEDDLHLLSTIAANVGAALQNAQLYQETQRRAEQMAALAEVGREISVSLDLPIVLGRIAEQACERLGGATSAVYLLQPDGKTLKAIAAQGDVAQQVLADEVQLGQGIVGHIVQSGVAERIDDTTRDARAMHMPGTEETPEGEKLMVAPLVVQGQAIGGLAVWRDPPDPPFNEAELSFSIGLAQQAAAAIGNARLFSEVQAQKSFSESLIHNTPVAIVTGTGGSTVTSWNPAAERLFGYTRDEVLGRDLDELITPLEMHPEGMRFKEQIMAGEALHTVTRRARKDGSLVDVELLAVRVTVPGQEPGYIAIYHDITELTAATRAIEESQRRMADIIDFLPDATVVIDRDGKVMAWNRAMEEMTGVKAAEMLGKGNYEYALPFYGERRPILIDLVLLPDKEIESRYAQLQREGATLMGEALVPQLRGQPAYLYATASALRNSKGEMAGAIETIRDISDRKQDEEELRQAKAEAEAATQAKSAFLAMMSHEIRTPMNAVIGMTSLLLDTDLTPEQREFAETIRSSGDALLAVINDILDFSKIEAGRIDLERQPFDVRECVESALSLVAGQAAEKGLELSCWIDPQVPAGIAGDETRLRQIVLNLLSNAVKFTAEGEIAVGVIAGDGQGTMDDGQAGRSSVVSLHFSVRDTGLGIPPDRMDRLFQSFSQVDSSTTRKYGGTGLGLAISLRLVELMGGRMWAESTGVPGQGSTFHFTVQAQVADIPARAELQAESPDLRGRQVLIVDDSATSRRILTLQAKAWGMQAQASGTPSEALAWVRRGDRFDVAIVDWQMPEMDGLMLAAELHKLDADLPLVMVSSLGQGEVEESKQFAAFLVKPVRASQLYNALKGILAGRPVAQAAKPAPPAQFDAEMGKRQPLRILLAEDNVVNQKLALRLLERLGYRADVAANGLEAIRAVERQPYDVVFMDVQMPEMDGLEATRQIVGRWATEKRPRIIAMTANALAEDREACLAAGMDDYLAKPIRVEELVAALSRSGPVSKDR